MKRHMEVGSPGRPYAASKAEVEALALKLMIRDGYANVTVEEIARQMGIGRTTVIRYFGSKSGIIWSAFDENNAQLRLFLSSAVSDKGALVVVREAICESTRYAIYRSEVWLERFELLDSSPQLRADAYSHWEDWKHAIQTYLVGKFGAAALHTAAAIAGAYQSIFVTELRGARAFGPDREAFLLHLNAAFEQALIDLSAIL